MGILICGLNGAGKSTIGRSLAERMSYRFIDNEDLYFPKTDRSYAYSNPRSDAEAMRILEELIDNDDRFIFAAVKGSYGEKLLSRLDCVILVEAPKATRMERVKQRSAQKFGDRILPGGDLAQRENEWFNKVESRPEDLVLTWLADARLTCPIIRVDGTRPVEVNVASLLSVLKPKRNEEPSPKTFLIPNSSFLILKGGSPK